MICLRFCYVDELVWTVGFVLLRRVWLCVLSVATLPGLALQIWWPLFFSFFISLYFFFFSLSLQNSFILFTAETYLIFTISTELLTTSHTATPPPLLRTPSVSYLLCCCCLKWVHRCHSERTKGELKQTTNQSIWRHEASLRARRGWAQTGLQCGAIGLRSGCC